MILEAIIGAIIVTCMSLYIFGVAMLAIKILYRYGGEFCSIAVSIEIGITVGLIILISGILCK